ncbi:DNA-directed RNA polymerase III subunit Rpc34-like protein [Coleophoma crateriformis]|uniref:DNA-directed RNA polymerase III subunit RPC6 n=1 Tax=Coleophoma crateriformis TaxID=565419 RepID=A0A3D8SMM2_9HELO|nr:DNA-directed RNA polymerase III subunit Rpc34-like protein [Coleophoma crateriformis]
MASSSGATGPDIASLKEALYKACLQSPSAHDGFRQQDFLDFEVIPDDDLNLVLQVAQQLVNEKLLWIFNDGEGIGWNVRSREDAAKYHGLTSEQEMVYQLVDSAGTDGIWSKTIKSKTNLHDAVFRSSIKFLETKGLIRDMKTVEHPNRKMYIKSSIRPSDRATGGSWYTDGEMDEEFISMLMDVLYNYISAKSFYRSSSSGVRKEPKKTKRVSAEEAKALRDKSLSKPPAEPESFSAARREYNRLLPMPPGYQNYPTLSQLTLFIENSPVTSVTLPANEIQQLLDILMFDNRIEQVIAGPEGVAYKAVRKSLKEMEMEMRGEAGAGGSNGLTEAPCGRCPVFDLCEEGGPVGPSNCEYFEEWLSL